MSDQSQVQVFGAGLACCAVEFHAALSHPEIAEQIKEASIGVGGNILVLAGTITHALAPTVRAAYDSMPEPRAVIAFGACTISGGPYWDSYSVVPGSPVPVDVHIPGCPPPPETLTIAMQQVRSILIEGAQR